MEGHFGRGLHSEGFILSFDGLHLDMEDTPDSVGIEDGDTIHARREQVGGKPVIYLHSPTEIDVSVALTLNREWSFSTIYPVVPAKSASSGAGERIQWDVRTHLDGNLTELNTGLDVAYLFWEAE